MAKIDVYQTVTDRIIEALGRGTVPWRKPWKESGLPIQVRNGRPYRGINVLILGLSGYTDPRWGTFAAMKDAAVAQAKSEGREIIIEITKKGKKYWEIKDGKKVWFQGGVRRGEKSTTIILWKPVKKKDDGSGEDPGSYRLLLTYNVFNVEQVDGIAPLDEEERREFIPIERAQQIVDNYVHPIGDGPLVEFGGNRAAYNLVRDSVMMPEPEMFEGDEAYYDTLFHELIHSTGAKKRLDRIESDLFGTDPYAREELVAEIGGAFLSGVAGLGIAGGEQNAAYLASWSRRFKDDPKLIVNAAGSAQRAADLILGTTFGEDDNEPSESELVAA